MSVLTHISLEPHRCGCFESKIVQCGCTSICTANRTTAPSPGVNLYPFDPTYGPGYVWHCHIVDHEDNEMMRPCKVVP